MAIIGPSLTPDHDVDYCFDRVCLDRPLINYRGNCGNLSGAVGPFAIEEGILRAHEPLIRMRIFQANTDKTILAKVPLKGGKYEREGDHSIPGVPGTGARIALRFLDPGGSVTGKLLPRSVLCPVSPP